MLITYLDSLLELPKRATRDEWYARYNQLLQIERNVNHVGTFWSVSELNRLFDALETAKMMAL